MAEKILLYNVKNPQDIIKAASNMRIVSGFIDESDTNKTLAELASGVKGVTLADITRHKALLDKESLIVFCDVSDKHMDKLLFEIRQKQLSITFKAVLTDTNKKWNINQMLVEMRRERFEYMRRNMK
ncbi:MAG: DUF3783 domain-containing protein [Eubacteriales bacterium]|nr:DUF3783 domain-containing protein [Eubacteriales bacterium]